MFIRKITTSREREREKWNIFQLGGWKLKPEKEGFLYYLGPGRARRARSKCVPWTGSNTASRGLVRNANWRTYPRHAEVETWVGAQQCVLTSPLEDSVAPWSLRIFVLQNIPSLAGSLHSVLVAGHNLWNRCWPPRPLFAYYTTHGDKRHWFVYISCSPLRL